MGRGRKLALFGIALAAGIAAGGACAQTADRAPAAGKPAATHPVTRPAVTRPAVTRPAVSRPAATRPAVAKHAPAQKAGPAKTAKPAAAAKPRKPAPPTSPVWLCRAASNGNTLAAFLLGRLYLTGAGVPLSPELGAAWLRVARGARQRRCRPAARQHRSDDTGAAGLRQGCRRHPASRSAGPGSAIPPAAGSVVRRAAALPFGHIAGRTAGSGAEGGATTGRSGADGCRGALVRPGHSSRHEGERPSARHGQ